MSQSLHFAHFRPRKAAEGAVRPPTAPRPPHTLCGHRRRRDTSPRGSAERSAPPQLSGERRGAASGSFGESPTSCTELYVVRFRRPKHFVPHALPSARRAATGAQSTNPATVPRREVFVPFAQSIWRAPWSGLGELRRRNTLFGRQRRRETLQRGSASSSRSASSLERAAERPRSVLVSPTPCTRP